MMAVEGPFLAAVIARLAEPKQNLAAYGVAFAIAIVIEAPVIMILSAATALADGDEAFRKLRNFTYALNVGITVGMLLLLLTPAFDLLALEVIGLPPTVAGLTRGALLLLLSFVWLNRRIPGVLIVGIGILCNLLVILSNSGLMPITPETLVEINPGSTFQQWPVGTHYGYSKDIIKLQQATRFWALSDMLVIPPPFPRPTAFSLGDLIVAAGIIVLMQGPSAKAELSKP